MGGLERSGRRVPVALLAGGALAVAMAMASVPAPTETADAMTVAAVTGDVPEVLTGDRWLRHHKEDLLPYWDMPEALGEPVGNFPSFRGRSGELLPESTNRGLSTLSRGVYGYSLAFLLTGEERYLTYARAGLSWIEAHAKDPAYGGYFGSLTVEGAPVNPTADKTVFDLASLGLAYGMYFNLTRDPEAEAGLLAVRDLLFDRYYDAAGNRVRDALTYDLATEVDTGGNGGDITDYLVPATAISLPNAAILSEPGRRAQFKADLRRLTQGLIDRHKDRTTGNGWWFWGRTGRVGNGFYNAAQTDFGHNIKSYELILNADRMFADHPWAGLSADRATLLGRAWDDAAGRWNEQRRGNAGGLVERDSGWWVHDEADQTLAALDLAGDFGYRDQLARSAQTFLDVYVDDDPAYPARETFARIERTETMTDLRKSFFGKNMLHNHEHALVMYLHGRALEGRPATLHYAFPEAEALTAVAKPYWFDAAGQHRTVSGALPTLPGHRAVTVEFTGLDSPPVEPYPAPDDTTPPTTLATVAPPANPAGWHRVDAAVSLSATDDLAGVREIHAAVQEREGAVPAEAFIAPGPELTLPAFTREGDYAVTYFAVDVLGNAEAPRTVEVRVDRTPPAIGGMPVAPCRLWPPDHRLVRVATVLGSDARSGLADLEVTVTSNEPGRRDVVVRGGDVLLRAERDPHGTGRAYTILAIATDRAGSSTTESATCVVPHDRSDG